MDFDILNLIEALSAKIGGFTIYLGMMLFISLYFFFRGKRKAKENQRPNPFQPA
ncbi:hypothetical protein [uncultured Pedobacter sp.]|uniref:hypothetical protein n=1 Tax=uncultured Pedobacter sp. TaxID=246139 RepID=UPI0025D503C9|nr:hypothetical protein [uncultured Pedobacter sp.]